MVPQCFHPTSQTKWEIPRCFNNCQRKKPSFVLYLPHSSQKPRQNLIFSCFFLGFSSFYLFIYFYQNPRKNQEKNKKKTRKIEFCFSLELTRFFFVFFLFFSWFFLVFFLVFTYISYFFFKPNIGKLLGATKCIDACVATACNWINTPGKLHKISIAVAVNFPGIGWCQMMAARGGNMINTY